MRERQMRRRLDRLERSPKFQPPPSPLEQIWGRALELISDEDLALLRSVSEAEDAREAKEAGVLQMLSPGESAALAAYEAAAETEARRMGFRSFADAERCGRRTRSG
jgi:hypothetical protein